MTSNRTTFDIAPRVGGGFTPSPSRIKPPVEPNFGPMRALAPTQSSETTLPVLPAVQVTALRPPVELPDVAPTLETPGWMGQLEQMQAGFGDAVRGAREKIDIGRAAVLGAGLHAGQSLVNSPRDFLENFSYGQFEGSLIAPDVLAKEPENPDELVQMVGAIPMMITEGFGGELAIIRGISWIAARGGRLAPLANRTLRLFGAGEDIGIPRQIAGSAGLSVGVEAGLQGTAVAYGDQTFEQAQSNMRPVAMLGAAVGGLAAAPKVASTALRPVLRIPAIETRVDDLVKGFKDRFQYEHEMRKFAGSETPPGGDLKTYNLADDFRTTDAALHSAGSHAQAAKHDFFAPLAASPTGRMDAGPGHLIRLIQAWREANLSTGLNTASAKRARELYKELHSKAPTEVKEVFQNHLGLAKEIFEEQDDLGQLGTRNMFYNGKKGPIIPADEAAERGVETLGARLTKASTERKLFNPRTIEEYSQGVTERFYTTLSDAAKTDLVQRVVQAQGRALTSLPEATQAALRAGKEEAGLKLILPKDRRVIRSMKVAMGDTEGEVAVPAAIARRLERFGITEEVPRWLERYVNPGTFLWKSSILMWSFADILTRNFLGDGTAFARSFPESVGNPKAFSSALRHQAEFYGVDHISTAKVVAREAAFSGVAGGVAGGFGIDGEFEMDDALTFGLIGAIGGAVHRLGKAMNKNRALRETSADYYNDRLFELRAERQRLERLGVVDSGYVGRELSNADDAFMKSSLEETTALELIGNEVATILSGTPVGATVTNGDFVSNFATVARERENFLRQAAFYHRISQGVPERLAAKQAREALVDYGKFTDFEKRWVRGFVLPFYSFARHNIPNWMRAAVGQDVGGGGLRAAAMTHGMLSFDAASQAWNERFFPEVERTLSSNVRSNFHLIAGNPATGEALRDDKGQPIVVGVELPYEQTLEILGIGRPGAIYSHIFGNGMDEDDSLVARWQRKEDFNLLSEAAKAPFRGAAEELRTLITPALSLPIEFLTGEHLAWGSPIIQDWKDEGEAAQWLDHAARKVVAAYSSVKRTGNEGETAATSHFGLGLPIQFADQDRGLKYRLVDMMELAQDDVNSEKPWAQRIRELVQQGTGEFTEDEYAAANEIAQEAADPATAAHILRYYTRYVGRASNIQKAWNEMDLRGRATFLKRLSPADLGAFVIYVNGGALFKEGT
jgi:hypothetical protein